MMTTKMMEMTKKLTGATGLIKELKMVLMISWQFIKEQSYIMTSHSLKRTESDGTICHIWKEKVSLNMKPKLHGYVFKTNTHTKMAIHCGEKMEFLQQTFDRDKLEIVGSLQQLVLWLKEAIDLKECL